MRARTFFRLINFWPPLLFSGISVVRVSEDCHELDVQLRLRFWNRNSHGTHYGGSIYSMTDPFYALMLSQILGRDYVVWDKAAAIDFRAPGRGVIRAEFRLSEDQIAAIRAETADGRKHFPEFDVTVVDEAGHVVATVHKTLYVRHRRT